MQEKRHDCVVEIRLCFFSAKVGDYKVSLMALTMCRSTDKQGIKEYTDRMMASASNQKSIQNLQTFVLGNWSAVMRTYHSKVITGVVQKAMSVMYCRIV